MLEVAREPMFQPLCAAGIVYLILGDIGEALICWVLALTRI
jgi:hypothetical protein